LTTQTLTPKTSPAVDALGSLLAAHSALTRELSSELVAEHGLTMSEFEVLLLLSKAEEMKLTRTDLSQQVRLSPSGITRMLNRLEDNGLVEKGDCSTDARITYAVLTEKGAAKLRAAAPDHMAAVDSHLQAVLSKDEISTLKDLLGRFFEGDADCSVGEQAESARPSAKRATE
jgi:DNA-binding MarR family transcriptional regulator